MACCLTEEKYGYEDCRFEKDVDENFHCSICYNVLKEPRMCRNNEHVFCLACITQHLKVNSQTCPECNEHLSVDTLRKARLVNNYLSKLKINCDYAGRGCSEFTCVENLETHVANCGFAPVLCSNDNCGMEINKHERIHHETKVCEYRRVKCDDCGQIQEVVEAMQIKVENNHVEMKRIVGKLEGSLVGMNKKVNEKIEVLKNSHEEMKKDQHEVKKEVGEIKNEVSDVKENLSKVKKDVGEVKVMMSQMLEKFNMLEMMNKLPSLNEEILNTPREDILIAGGLFPACSSVEIFSWEKNGWFEVSPMNEMHCGASSFIYKDQLYVLWGRGTATIEILDLNELSLKWMEFPGEFRCLFRDHRTVVCQERVINIGGYDEVESESSDRISELQHISPFTMKRLCQMPGSRHCFGVEVYEDKVLIFGGKDYDGDARGSVLEFDPKRNDCKEMPPLPHPLWGMSTVRWRDQVVVLGGYDNLGQVLNDVFMYDCKTGKIAALPSMLKKRGYCCAVITGNTIVVMGGENDDGYLNSVECLTMGGYTLNYLPAMNETRWSAVAEALPSTRKCVYF